MTSSMSKDEDSKPITLNLTISAGLNRFKNTRINGVSKAFGISTKDTKKEKMEQIISRLTTILRMQKRTSTSKHMMREMRNHQELILSGS
ncbi:MAG: hypothetical protein J5U17_03415 [Candidatus Methanoperedens sp.]|nr:hypothetical protein [Candidatus Methanoperedens sp.]